MGAKADAIMQTLGLPFECAIIALHVFGVGEVERVPHEDEEEPCTES